MDLKQIGHRIAAVRHDRGFTQRELAEAAGVTPQFITVLEAGYKIPTLIVIAGIADKLNVTLDYLVNGAGEKS